MNPAPTIRYYEDLSVGDKFPTANLTVTEAEIIAFAKQYDPQSFHTDATAAKDSAFGRLVASGWHTAALSMRLMVQGEIHPAGGMIGLGVEKIEWPQPVLPGDTLTVVSEVVEKRLSQSRPDRGLVKFRSTTFNQRGEPVQRMAALQIVLCQPASATN